MMTAITHLLYAECGLFWLQHGRLEVNETYHIIFVEVETRFLAACLVGMERSTMVCHVQR